MQIITEFTQNVMRFALSILIRFKNYSTQNFNSVKLLGKNYRGYWMCTGNGLSYIQELTDRQLLEFISDLQDSPQKVKDQFDYQLHVNELISRSTSGKMVTRAQVFKALNNVDKSFDYGSEDVFVIDAEEFLTELGL